MPAPTLIGWDTANNNILQPDVGHIAQGWNPNEKPSSTHHNWLFQNIMQWIAYIGGPLGTGPFVQNISAVTTVTVTHNFNRAHHVSIYASSGGVGLKIDADTITAGLNADVITFAGAQSGSIVIW